MATIHFIWNGKDEHMAETTSSYSRNATTGFFDPAGYKESWTGSNLSYNQNSAYPTGGTLHSWSFQQKNTTFAFSFTDLNYKIPAGTSYNGLISGMVAGRDEWHGDGGHNFFYWSAGGDMYHGGAGIDTLDSLGFSKGLVLGSKPSFARHGHAITVAAIGDLDVTLDSVERLRFKEVSVALDLDGNAGAAARIAGAVYGRDILKAKELMGVAIGLLDSGMTPVELMAVALRAKLGDNYTNAKLVNLVYRNVTNTAPTAQDAAPYESMLNDGRTTGPELAWAAAASDINADSIDLTGLSASGLDYVPWHG
jgi:serralysin